VSDVTAAASPLRARRYLTRAKSNGASISLLVRLRLTPQERERLALHGRARGGFSASAIATMLIERVIADDLFKAILDD